MQNHNPTLGIPFSQMSKYQPAKIIKYLVYGAHGVKLVNLVNRYSHLPLVPHVPHAPFTLYPLCLIYFSIRNNPIPR